MEGGTCGGAVGGGAVDVLHGVGEDVEVVGGLRRRVGSEDGAAAGREGEGDCATDAFCCATVGWLGIGFR